MTLVTAAAAGVEVARERRAARLAVLDQAVTDAHVAHEVALAVLAAVLGNDETAAAVAGVDVPAVRGARRRAPADRVDGEVAAVMEAAARPRGGSSGVSEAGGEAPGTEGTD